MSIEKIRTCECGKEAFFNTSVIFEDITVAINGSPFWEKGNATIWTFKISPKNWIRTLKTELRQYAIKLNIPRPPKIWPDNPHSGQDITFTIPKVHFLFRKYTGWNEKVRM